MPRPPHLRPAEIRSRVEPGDIPAEKVARRLHITAAAFEACKVRLFMRGFPRPDPDTGMYDLDAVDRWRHRRHPSLFPELTAADAPVSSASPTRCLGDISREAQERRRNG